MEFVILLNKLDDEVRLAFECMRNDSRDPHDFVSNPSGYISKVVCGSDPFERVGEPKIYEEER